MAAIRLPAWLNSAAVSYPAENDRLTLAGLLVPGGASPAARGGVLPANNSSFVVSQHSTPNMSVDVTAGQCVIPGTVTATQGAYVGTSDATQTLAIAAANATNPRIDIVCITVEDSQYAGANNDAVLQVITGTPAASPSAPAAPANSIILAQIAVAANATSITNANITDQRTFTVARGGIVPCLSTARPASPYTGMTIFETDTGRVLVYAGSSWQRVVDPSPTWTSITLFSNSWTAATGALTPKFYVDPDGVAHLFGRVNAGTTANGTVMFTLPSAARPANNTGRMVVGSDNPGPAQLYVNSDGTVQVFNLQTGATFLDLASVAYQIHN